jgi:tRNA G10  N-methylase Trm11
MRLLAFFRHPPELSRFCIAELKALFRIHNIQPHEIFDFQNPEHETLAKEKPYMINEDLFPNFPFVYLKNHPEEILRQIIDRAILIKEFVNVISEGSTYEEVIANVNLEQFKPYLDSTDTFLFRVDPHSKTYT